MVALCDCCFNGIHPIFSLRHHTGFSGLELSTYSLCSYTYITSCVIVFLDLVYKSITLFFLLLSNNALKSN